MANNHSPYGKRLLRFKVNLFTSFLILALFLVFTWSVTWFDVQGIGINGSEVGFATINGLFHEMFPDDKGCYNATEVLGYICLLIAACNAFLAFVDFIRSRGFKGMQKRYLITMFFYAAVVVAYIAFSLIPINSRPNNYEQSYPSSHTMLALCVLYSEIVLLGYGARKNRFWIILFDTMLVILMITMTVLRLLSGVHWLTDIVGGVLLSFTLMSFYRTFVRFFDPLN